MRATADGGTSNVVDVYNSATGAWSTAQLSVARSFLAAASVGNVALFAGGRNSSAFVAQGDGGGEKLFVVACVFCVCPCCGITVMFALRPIPLSCAPLQIMFLLMLWMCTTLQRGRGRRLSSAWRAMLLQLHLSETWLCSLGVGGLEAEWFVLRAC